MEPGSQSTSPVEEGGLIAETLRQGGVLCSSESYHIFGPEERKSDIDLFGAMNSKVPTQTELFKGDEPVEIPGAAYIPDFITPEEEREIIRQIELGVWTHEFARRRQHYGIAYEKPDWKNPASLPPWIQEIAGRVLAAGLFSKMPVQALVNEYEPGQGISAHKDYEPFDEVASLSLASGCLMEFAKLGTGKSKALWLEPRSLLVLTNEARHEWTHAIRPRLNDIVGGVKIPRQRRLSLTLRTIAPGN